MSTHHITTHYRQQLKAQEATASQALRSGHAHMLAALHPHLEQVYREIETEQANHEEGKIPLTFLYEQDRLPRLLRIIEQSVDHYSQLAQITVGQAEQAAIGHGTRAVHAHMKAAKHE